MSYLTCLLSGYKTLQSPNKLEQDETSRTSIDIGEAEALFRTALDKNMSSDYENSVILERGLLEHYASLLVNMICLGPLNGTITNDQRLKLLES